MGPCQLPNNLDIYGSLPWLPVGYFFRGSAAEVITLFSEMLKDAGVVSFILFLYILIGFIPLFHPFKHKSGKVFGNIYFISWGLAIFRHLFYGYFYLLCQSNIGFMVLNYRLF